MNWQKKLNNNSENNLKYKLYRFAVIVTSIFFIFTALPFIALSLTSVAVKTLCDIMLDLIDGNSLSRWLSDKATEALAEIKPTEVEEENE
jgi:hypothetical protein